MKKILLIILLFPFAAQAQTNVGNSFEITVSAGAAFNSTPTYARNIAASPKGGVNPYIGLSGVIPVSRNVSVGLYVAGFSASMSKTIPSKETDRVTEPSVLVMPTARMSGRISENLSVVGGIMAGAALHLNGGIVENAYGFSAGIYAALKYRLSDHFSLHVASAPTYNFMNLSPKIAYTDLTTKSANFAIIPLTVGVSLDI